MGLDLVIYTVIIIINLWLFFVTIINIRSSSQKKSKLFFLLLLLGIVIWVLSLTALRFSENSHYKLTVGRLTFMSPLLILSAFYFFIRHTFITTRDKFSKRCDYLVVITSVIGVIHSLTDLLIQDVKFVRGQPTPSLGNGYYLYIIALVFLSIFSIALLATRYMKADLVTKKQIKLIGIGFTLSITFAFTTNVILARILPTNLFSTSIGQLSILPFIFIIYFSIIRYRFLDIRFIIGKIIYYFILSVVPFIFFHISNMFILILLGDLYTPASYLLGSIISIIFVVAFNRLNEYLKKQVSTRFINPGYDPYEVVDSLGKTLALTLEMDGVIIAVISILKRTIRADSQGFIIIKEINNKNKQNTKQTEKYKIYGKSLKKKKINPDDYKQALFIWEKINKNPIIYDELKYLGTNKYNQLKHLMNPIEKQMEKDQIRVLIPIGTKEKIVGILLLGQKEADSPYTQQDLELLTSIASTAGLALARSLFYEEIKELNIGLQEKVKLATQDLRKQNKNLEKTMTKLEKLRQRERDMVDVMGHELRTPITIVRNALVVLKKLLEKAESNIELDAKKIYSYVEKALESTRREITLIETLLAATKIDANRVQITLEKVDLIDVVEDAIEGQKLHAKERNLYMKFDNIKEKANWYVYADRVRIQEVMDNFLSNAVKYTIKGGITITMEKVHDPNNNNELAKINIIDTGIGIPEEDLKKLGRKFFRARQYIKDNEKDTIVRPGGTGLGLYVSFELIRIMGGYIDIKSKIGEGSTFSFTIPLYKGQERKHLDQTFDEKTTIKEKEKTEKEKQKQLNQIQNNIEKASIDEQNSQNKKYITQNPKGYTEITTTQEIMGKIKKAREVMEEITEEKKEDTD